MVCPSGTGAGPGKKAVKQVLMCCIEWNEMHKVRIVSCGYKLQAKFPKIFKLPRTDSSFQSNAHLSEKGNITSHALMYILRQCTNITRVRWEIMQAF